MGAAELPAPLWRMAADPAHAALFLDFDGTLAAIVEDPATVAPRQPVEVRLAGDDRALLLFDWLNELLYRFDTEHLLFGRFETPENLSS